MSYNASTPPPSYNDAKAKESENGRPDIGFHAPQSNDQYTYNPVPINSAQMPTQPMQMQQQPVPMMQQQLPMMQQQVPMMQQQIPMMQQPILMQPVVIPAIPVYGPHPARLICPSCQKNMVTRIEYKTSATTHVIAGMLCFMGCCCLAPIPYFVDSCKNSVHYCSDCGNYLGTYANGGTSRYRGRRHGYNDDY